MNTFTRALRGKKQLICLSAVLFSAAAVRVIGLDWGLPNEFHVITYNGDEYTALADLQRMNPSKLDFNPASEKNPYAIASGTFNLYTYAALLKLLSVPGWIYLSADKEFYYQNPGEWSKFFLTGRALSVLYGLLSVWLTCLLAGKMYGRRTGLLAAFFTALMPAHVVHSRYLIMNVPGVFWILLSFYFMTKILDGGLTKDYFFAGMSAGLAVSTRYSALPLPLALVLAHFISAAPGKSLKKTALSLLAAGLFFLIGTPYAILDLPGFLNGLKAMSLSVASLGEHTSLLADIGTVTSAVSEGLGLFTFLACLPGVALALVRREKADILLLAWIAILLTIFTKTAHAVLPGRIIPILPFLAILGARFLAVTWDRLPAIGRGIPAAVLACSLLYYSAYFRLVLGTDIRDKASAWIIANIKPGASIGLVREPSWFSPGIIDRQYRHPDQAMIPGARFVPLTSEDWKSRIGYDLLEAKKPDLIVITDVEALLLPEQELSSALKAGGYSRIKDFTEDFSLLGLKLQKRLPIMFYTPNWIRIFARTGKA